MHSMQERVILCRKMRLSEQDLLVYLACGSPIVMSGVGNCSAYGASSADRPETRGAGRAARGERTWKKKQHFAKVRFCEALETGFKTLQESPLLRKQSEAARVLR